MYLCIVIVPNFENVHMVPTYYIKCTQLRNLQVLSLVGDLPMYSPSLLKSPITKTSRFVLALRDAMCYSEFIYFRTKFEVIYNASDAKHIFSSHFA